MESSINALQFNSAFQMFLKTLVLTHLSGHYSVCVIRGAQDDVRLEFPRPSVMVALGAVDSSRTFENILVSSINAGCEGFLVLEGALFPFLDNYRSAHEAAYVRAFNKRIVAVTRLDASEREQLLQHDTMEVTPNILLVNPNMVSGTVTLYTTILSPAEPRGILVNLTLIDEIMLKMNTELLLPESVSEFPDKLSNMQGRRVRLSTLPYPPCAVANEVPLGQGNARSTVPANYSLQADGTEILMILELCRRHNCTLEIELVANSEWGEVYPNGSSDGLIGSLIDRRSDVAVAAIYRWYNWYKYVTMSAYTGRSGVSCLVPRPRLLPFWQTPFLSFPASLWLMVCVSFCIGTVAVFITERARQYVRSSRRSLGERYKLLDAIFFMLSLYVEQSVPLPNDMMAGSILLSFLLFGGFMVGNSYAGALASVMTIPRYEKSIDTRADFAASGMKWSGPTIAWMNSLLMAEQPELVTIRNSYEVHGGDTLARFSHTRRDMGYVHERLQYGSYALESFIDINATRLLQPLKEDVFWEQIITACSKTWPLMGFYDDLILRVQQNGILRYWELGSVIRNMGLEIQRNLANARVHDADHEPVKLLIAHFLGVFFILFVGLTLATLAFIVELLVYRANADLVGKVET
uniref:Ionotropic glutamate receptor C-terminal domain-containing protein n=1 Tax=Anopheles funestus TaxID=62324 RepID=A0A182RVR8_ANOFN